MSKPHFVICQYEHHLGLIWPRHTAGVGESSPISDVVRLLELVLTEAKVSFETIDCRTKKENA